MEDLAMTLARAYAGKRVLLTGHTGFKGSWLGLWLAELGAEVFGFALPPPTSPSNFDVSALGSVVRDTRGDVRDFGAVAAAFADARPDFVFHLAAQPIVREAYEDPKATFDTNIGGTTNVLECIRRNGNVSAAVMITSDKCYENVEWEYAYRENDQLGGRDPYSASKAAAELVISAYRRSYFGRDSGPAIASARAGNVIGGGDWARDRILPDCVRALVEERPITLRNPASVRPWQHVLEPLSGYLLLGAKLLEDRSRFSDAFNFGPATHDHLTVEEVAREFVDHWRSGTIEIVPDQAAPHEAKLLRLSCEKAGRVLRWAPRLDGRAAVRWAAEWYRAWHDSANRPGAMREFTLQQIRRYGELPGATSA